MGSEWMEERFGSLVRFVSDKSKAKDASIDTYISTENMVVDFGGISPASALPLTGSITKFKVGDTVRIEECAPISKTKRWTVVTEA